MKKLFLILLASLMIAGCSDSPPECAVFGTGAEYRIMELTFCTEQEVDVSLYRDELQIKDGDYGYITIEFTPLSDELVTSPLEDMGEAVNVQESLKNGIAKVEGSECVFEQTESTAVIDGQHADTAMRYIKLSVPEDENLFHQYMETAKVTTDRFSYSITYHSYMDVPLELDVYKERARNIYYGISFDAKPRTEHDFNDKWADIAAEKPLSTDKRHEFQDGMSFMLPEGFSAEHDSPFADTTYVCADGNGSLSFVNRLPQTDDNYIRCYDEFDYLSGTEIPTNSALVTDLRHITVNEIEMVYIRTQDKDILIFKNNENSYFYLSIDNTCERDLTSLILNSIKLNS